MRPFLIALAVLLPTTTLAEAAPHRAAVEDPAMSMPLFHMLRVEGDWSRKDGEDLASWEAEGWIGRDVNKLFLKSEGEVRNGTAHEAEVWGLYSRKIADFWDIQAGLRQDFAPEDTTFAVLGVEGLAPYFFETAAHVYVSQRGDTGARIEQSIELPITQRLIAKPHLKADFWARDVPEYDAGAGLSTIETGIQFRYEIVRKFAPYLDINYQRGIGETAGLMRASGEDAGELTFRIGLRFWL